MNFSRLYVWEVGVGRESAGTPYPFPLSICSWSRRGCTGSQWLDGGGKRDAWRGRKSLALKTQWM